MDSASDVQFGVRAAPNPQTQPTGASVLKEVIRLCSCHMQDTFGVTGRRPSRRQLICRVVRPSKERGIIRYAVLSTTS